MSASPSRGGKGHKAHARACVRRNTRCAGPEGSAVLGCCSALRAGSAQGLRSSWGAIPATAGELREKRPTAPCKEEKSLSPALAAWQDGHRRMP